MLKPRFVFCGVALLFLCGQLLAEEKLWFEKDYIKHRFYMYNKSPIKTYIYKIRHTIIFDNWENHHDVYRGITLEANETSTFYEMTIKDAESVENFQDAWVALFHYDNKNFTTEKPFNCRIYKEDTVRPIEVIFDFYDLYIHVVPPVSKACYIKIHHVPEPQYENIDYPRFAWMSTGGLWW